MMACKVAFSAALLALILHVAGAQSVACNASQVAGYSGVVLTNITGDSYWTHQYYNFSGMTADPIINQSAINYTGAYLVYSNYAFSGPDSLGTTPQLIFILKNNTSDNCASMKLISYSRMVMPYYTANLITAGEAANTALGEGYEVVFGGLTLIPPSNPANVLELVPGYEVSGTNYTVYADAENGTVWGSQPSEVPPAIGLQVPQLPLQLNTYVSDAYKVLKVVWGWLESHLKSSA